METKHAGSVRKSHEAPGYISGVVFKEGLFNLNSFLKSRQFILVTAWRDDISQEVNVKNNGEIREFCSQNQSRVDTYRLIGHWLKSFNWTNHADAVEHPLSIINITESSFLILKTDVISAGEFKQIAIDLCLLSSRETVLFKDADGVLKGLNLGGSEVIVGKGFTWDILGDAYASLRGYPDNSFIFDGSLQPGSLMDCHSYRHSGISYFSPALHNYGSRAIKADDIK